MRVLIFSRPVHTGKTMALEAWCAARAAAGDTVAGVLAPDVAGVRHFHVLASGELFAAQLSPAERERAGAVEPAAPAVPMAAAVPAATGAGSAPAAAAAAADAAAAGLTSDAVDPRVVAVGRYAFWRSAFERAADALRDAAAAAPPPAWLVIDEIGKLELRGEGFAAALRAVLALPPASQPGTLVLAVREGLVDDVVAAFALKSGREGPAVCSDLPP
jgi:hypothetical protein